MSQKFDAHAQPPSQALVTRELIMLQPGKILEPMLLATNFSGKHFTQLRPDVNTWVDVPCGGLSGVTRQGQVLLQWIDHVLITHWHSLDGNRVDIWFCRFSAFIILFPYELAVFDMWHAASSVVDLSGMVEKQNIFTLFLELQNADPGAVALLCWRSSSLNLGEYVMLTLVSLMMPLFIHCPSPLASAS